MIAAIFFVATLPAGLRTADVDVCELNRVIGSDGTIRFTQVILWRWVPQWPKAAGHHVSEYFIIDEKPRVDWKNGRRRVIFRGRNGVSYEIRPTTYRETIGPVDPEAMDRHEWPDEFRRPYFGGGW